VDEWREGMDEEKEAARKTREEEEKEASSSSSAEKRGKTDGADKDAEVRVCKIYDSLFPISLFVVK
jgi:hypothetical protein